MKKQNGFVFMETIIVISVLCVTLLILFSSYSYILRKSRSRNAFDTTETIYKTYLIKNLMDSYAKQYTSTGIGVEYYIQQHLGGTKPECYKSTYGANSSYTCDLSQVDPASWLYQAHVSFEVDKIYYLNPSLILKSSYEKEWLNTFDATTIDYIRSLGKNTNNNILVVKYKKYYNKTNGSYEVLHSSMKITEQNGILVSSKDYVASVHLDYQGNGTGNKTDFNINYGGSNTFEVTPESGYYLSSITCTNGYTVVANTSTTATGKQTITVYNNNVGDSSTCTIEFSGVANAVSIKVANPATGSVDKTNINVGYNSTNHVKVTPVKGYYLDAVTCTNGYTVNAVTGTTASEAQEITIRNPGNSKPSDCTVVFGRKVSNGALQKGDYVILRPDAKKITIDKADTGYDYNQEIDLSKISAWRVLDVYSDGTADLVLNIPSKELIMFKGQTGYRKYIYTLNKIADQYKNSNFTIKARAVGYSNQGETITGDIYKFVPRDIEYYYVKEHKDKIFNVNTIEVQGSVNDSGYKSDILKLKEIEDTQMDYWIASRTFESSLDTHVPLSGIFSGKKADLPAKIDESYLDIHDDNFDPELNLTEYSPIRGTMFTITKVVKTYDIKAHVTDGDYNHIGRWGYVTPANLSPELKDKCAEPFILKEITRNNGETDAQFEARAAAEATQQYNTFMKNHIDCYEGYEYDVVDENGQTHTDEESVASGRFRPIVTIKAGITITGDGSVSNPWELHTS